MSNDKKGLIYLFK